MLQITKKDSFGPARFWENVMKQSDKKDTQQVSAYLPMHLYQRLKQTKIDTHESSMNNVVRAALKHYMALVDERKRGSEVISVAPDGTKTKYHIFVD